MGPLSYAAVAVDGFAWAHRHMQLLLLMESHGPIGLCSCCCQWFHVGPLSYAAVAVDGSAWAHQSKQLLLPDGFVWAYWHI